MKSLIRQAFLAASNGFSPDRVVADPELDASFIARCNAVGLSLPVRDLNLALLNARKSGALAGLPRARSTSFPDEEEYRFAAEVAARFMQKRFGESLDCIVADPRLVVDFDAASTAIVPGYLPLRYRWAALNLRKRKRLQPELATQLLTFKTVELGRLDRIDVTSIPRAPGLYMFLSSTHVLYVGEAGDLRHRIEKHLDHSDNKGLARWLWQHGITEIHLELTVLPDDTGKRSRRAIEREMIKMRQPMFNVQGL